MKKEIRENWCAKLSKWVGDKLFAVRYHLQKRKHRPILIVGCGHSGTSVLLAMLGAHSKIHAIPSETYFANPESDLRSSAQIARSLNRRFGTLAIQARKFRWVEKTPRHILHLGRIFEIYPNSQVLLIIRDGRDVACSIQDRTGSLEQGIERWVNDNRAGEPFWQDPRVMVLKYEQMVQNREAVLKEIMTFLGEEFEEAMLHHHKDPKLFYANTIEKPDSAIGNSHAQFRNWQINQPFFDGRGKWQRLTQGELDLINHRAGDMLAKYGYTMPGLTVADGLHGFQTPVEDVVV